MKKQHKQPPPTPQGNRKNISKEVHRRASVVAQALMRMPAKPAK